MTFLHHSPWGCQEGQGRGAKGSGNELQICEALSEGAPVTASPLSFKAAPATPALHHGNGKGPRPLGGSCGTALGERWALACCVPHLNPRGTPSAPWPLLGALQVASVLKVSACMVGSLTGSCGTLLPMGELQGSVSHCRDRSLAGQEHLLPAPGSGSTFMCWSRCA